MPKETQKTKSSTNAMRSTNKEGSHSASSSKPLNKNTPNATNHSSKTNAKIGESTAKQKEKKRSDEKATPFNNVNVSQLVNKYTKYAKTDEGMAVLFVKKYLRKANSRMWVDIVGIEAPKYYEIGYMQFKTVVCELFPRTAKPEYPPKSQYLTKEEYELVCRAIDWETAKKDVKEQKKRGVRGQRYRIEGVIYVNKKDRPPIFLQSAPDKIKALSNDVNNQSSSLWEEAYQYINPDYLEYDEFQYKIKKIEQLN
jgi:hypothetical protein